MTPGMVFYKLAFGDIAATLIISENFAWGGGSLHSQYQVEVPGQYLHHYCSPGRYDDLPEFPEWKKGF